MHAKYLDIEDWTPQHQRLAAKQGWQLIETGQYGSGSIEVRCIDSDIDLIRLADRSEKILHDEDAVSEFKQAFLRNEDHAVTAWKILQVNSPLEFNLWAMSSWKSQRQVA
jgi:hypothetical protein